MKTFIQKYVPLKLDEFPLNLQLISLLKKLINMNNLNMVLIGSNESGKTSILNAVIKEYYENNPTYKENIMYINNSKEQGIQYFRTDLKTFCQTHSLIKGKKKLVVIDDIDTINEFSQQVFRNFIDNYSNNVSFICSCTNIQKVIESIQSRLLILKLEPITKNIMENICNIIIEKENINIDKESIQLLIQLSNYSLKIMINYLEKFKLLDENITIDVVQDLCTNINFDLFEKYIYLIKNKQLHDGILILLDLHDKGYSVMDILDSFYIFMKQTNILNEKEKYEITFVVCKFIQIFHEIHEDEIELALFSYNIYKIFLRLYI
jgi:DNA polymerase III delta prime subunit